MFIVKPLISQSHSVFGFSSFLEKSRDSEIAPTRGVGTFKGSPKGGLNDSAN